MSKSFHVFKNVKIILIDLLNYSIMIVHKILYEVIYMNSFERRIRAFSIDISMATVMFFLLVVVIGAIDSVSSELKLTLAVSIAYFGVLIIPHFFSKGQSFGKRNQKMKIVYNSNNETPSLLLLILREVVKGILMIITFGFYLMVCGIIASSRKDGRVIHDFIFKTKVICLTLYVSDKEGSVINRTETVKKHLEGSSYD